MSSGLVQFLLPWLLRFAFIFADFEILGARRSCISLLKHLPMKSIVLDVLQSLGVKKASSLGFWVATALFGGLGK